MLRDKEMILLQVECTFFFEKNPFAFQTIAGLSKRLGRSIELLEPVLQRLTELMILEKIGEGPVAVYRYIAPNIIDEMDLGDMDEG